MNIFYAVSTLFDTLGEGAGGRGKTCFASDKIGFRRVISRVEGCVAFSAVIAALLPSDGNCASNCHLLSPSTVCDRRGEDWPGSHLILPPWLLHQMAVCGGPSYGTGV